jgi:hypothetical protein
MNTIRLQFEVDEDALREIEQLQELGGLRTKKDLLNNALTLLQWAVRQRSNGRAIISEGEDGSQRELEMPFLEAVAGAARRKLEAAGPARRRLAPARS